MIFTNPLGKCSPLIVKSGGAMTYSNHKANLKRGAVGSFSHQFITNSTLNLKLNGGQNGKHKQLN